VIEVCKSFRIPKKDKDKNTNIIFNGIFTVNIAKEITRNMPIFI